MIFERQLTLLKGAASHFLDRQLYVYPACALVGMGWGDADVVIKREGEELLRLINSYRGYADPAQTYRAHMRGRPLVHAHMHTHTKLRRLIHYGVNPLNLPFPGKETAYWGSFGTHALRALKTCQHT